jgi:hypothetical protein
LLGQWTMCCSALLPVIAPLQHNNEVWPHMVISQATWTKILVQSKGKDRTSPLLFIRRCRREKRKRNLYKRLFL